MGRLAGNSNVAYGLVMPEPPPFVIGVPTTAQDWASYYDLRWRVLREPWAQPRGSERDSLDETAFHLCAKCASGSIIATGRLHFNSLTEAQVRYMAVDPAFQGCGVGKRLLEALEALARSLGCRIVTLNSRDSALRFYQKQGYIVDSPAPILFGSIEHVKMSKQI